MELWSAFLIGLAGSLHCAGMCGPLLIALPLSSKSRLEFYTGRVIYNSGRIASYIFLGLLFGTFGSAAALFGFQKNVSVLLGTAIIFFVIVPRRYKNKMSKFPACQFYTGKLQLYMGKLLKKNSAFSLLLLGILNGLLPCGMVYMGLAGAAASDGLVNGMVYMALFGLGTLPLMFTISVMGQYAGPGLRGKLKRAVPLLALLLGAVFIFRGLDLGIPFISPKLPPNMRSHPKASSQVKSAGMKPVLERPEFEDCCR